LSAAFRDVTVPPDQELVASDRYWDEVQGSEPLVNPHWLKWDEVPPETLMSNFDVLCFLSPVAYRFYLAAFVHCALKNQDRYLMLADYARYGLPPASQGSSVVDFSGSKFEHFTPEQISVVERFVTFYDSQYALNT
jgi:hypothetical protein